MKRQTDLLARTIVALTLSLCAQYVAGQEGLAQKPGLDNVSIIRRIPLAETDSTVLASVGQIEFSPNGALLAMRDVASGAVFLYDARSGALVQSMKPSAELSDLLTASASLNLNPEIEYLSQSAARQHGLRVQFGEGLLANRYTAIASMSDSSIVLGALIRTVKRHKVKNIYGATADAASVTIGLDGKVTNLTPLGSRENVNSRNPTGIYVHADAMSRLPDGRYLTNVFCDREGVWDSLYLFGMYDSTGKRVGLDARFPPQLRTRRLGYNLLSPVLAADHMKAGYALRFVPAVYSIHGGLSFPLQQFAGSNENFYRESANPNVSYDSLVTLAEVSIRHIFFTRHNTVIVVLRCPSSVSRVFEWLVQEYDTTGTWLHQGFIPDSSDVGRVQSVGYHPGSSELAVARVSPRNGWVVELMRYHSAHIER